MPAHFDIIYTEKHQEGTAVRADEVHHFYGSKVHLAWDPMIFTWLAEFGSEECLHPRMNKLVKQLYRRMIHTVVSRSFPRFHRRATTRMVRQYPAQAQFHAPVVDYDTKVTVVNVARAGTSPAGVCFEALGEILLPAGLHQDHLMMQRTVEGKSERVTGAGLSGFKPCGNVDEHIVIFPDPMGATGHSLCKAAELYAGDAVPGMPAKMISMNLMVTPEFIRHVTKRFPKMEIWALRLDRGLSSEKALNSIPGAHPDEERGLTDNHYIVPGAGGVGELLNNALS